MSIRLRNAVVALSCTRCDRAIDVVASNPEWQAMMRDPTASDLSFVPHPGWVGHIELEVPGPNWRVSRTSTSP